MDTILICSSSGERGGLFFYQTCHTTCHSNFMYRRELACILSICMFVSLFFIVRRRRRPVRFLPHSLSAIIIEMTINCRLLLPLTSDLELSILEWLIFNFCLVFFVQNSPCHPAYTAITYNR